MSKIIPFEVVISDNNMVGVELSDDFLALSAEEQLKVIENFFWERNMATINVTDISTDTVKDEYTILLAETIMGQLKRGQRIEKGSNIEFSLSNLSDLANILL